MKINKNYLNDTMWVHHSISPVINRIMIKEFILRKNLGRFWNNLIILFPAQPL
jgi:hypothetical protein